MTQMEWDSVPPQELGQTLGDRLKKSLRKSGLTIADMSAFMEVHRNTVSGWMADRAKPMPIFVRTWAEKTGVPIEWLRDGVWPTPQAAPTARTKPPAAARTAKPVAAAKPRRAVPAKAAARKGSR